MSIIVNMPNEAYHRHPAVSASVLAKLHRSPLHARAYLDGVREETAAMRFGTAVHAAVLEPERFAGDFAAFGGDRRTKEGKAAYEALQARGATVLNVEDYDTVCAIARAVRNHETAGPLLAPGTGQAENSVFWQHGALECKCRPDWWAGDVVVDLKTTEDASPAAFARSVVNYRYHLQAAHYLTGTQAARFLFVVVEKKAPHAVAVYELDAAALALGHQTREQLLDVYASGIEFDEWPGFPPGITTLSLPAWAAKGDEQ